MSSSQKIWLVRHGETEWSASGAHTGRTDIPLNEVGRERARQLRDVFRGRTFSLVLTSPLRRATETCSLAGFDDQAVIDPDLQEWDYGIFEGRKTADIRKDCPEWTIWTANVDKGESLSEVGARADVVIQRVSATVGDAILFAHGHIFRILTARWLGLPPEAGRLFGMDTATLNILGYEREQRVIRLWNFGESFCDRLNR
jgi:broad specificity phosphatase PhoE